MKHTELIKTRCAVLLALAATSCLAQSAPATPQAPEPATTADDAAIVLDPFTVTTEHEGYMATDTLGGMRTKSKLADTASAVSVITPKFMQDVGITSAQDLLLYTTNTEVAGLNGNFSGVATRGAGISVSGPSEGTRLVNPAGVNRSRGLTAMDNTRNYMPTDIPWDGFNINRVDISRGPNSFLFGTGSPSGISNVSTKDASFKNEGSVEAHYGSFGTTRQSLDLNTVILRNELSFRLDLVNDKTQFQQEPAFNNGKRLYGALRYDPSFLNTSWAHTKIQANIERGQVRSNNPRTLPPLDYITGYLNDTTASKTGYNPWTYLENNNVNAVGTSTWSSHGSIGNQYQWGNTPQYTWDGATGALMRTGQSTWYAPSDANYGAGDVNNNIYHVHTTGHSDQAKAANYAYLQANNQVDGGPYKGAYKGTVTYLDRTLSDSSIFDFYNKLIDGENKREWQDWNAYNLSIVQTFFQDRLAIQGVVDHQEYTYGQQGVLNSRTPVIIMDLDSHLLTYPTWTPLAQANPNLGRPLVFGDYGSGTKRTSTRDNYQVTAAYTLNFSDLFGKGELANFLGKHEFTGLGSRFTTTEENTDYKFAGIDPVYAKTYANVTKESDNGINWLAYLGGSLLGGNGSGANLSNISTNINPASSFATPTMAVYKKEWTAASTVNPTAPWSVTLPNGTVKNLTQADNPANYRGWSTTPANVLTPQTNIDELYTGSSMREQRITSAAFMYQGHFWDDTIIPSMGIRQDQTLQRGNVATQDGTSGLINLIEDITDTGVKATTRSTSYGIALHLPKAIKKNLPEGTDFSLYYFHGANETPKVRYAVDGSQLPNEKGKTDDYSAQLDLYGRFSMRVTAFKTQSTNAQASYGQPLGTNGWLIDSLPAWTLTMAACGLAVQELGAENTGDLGQPWNNWIWQWAVDHPEVSKQISASMKTDFVEMFPQTYWDQYGSNVDISAVKRGDWLHVLKNNNVPWPWNATASHQIHGQWAIIDQNLESKGYEIEMTARPLKNWDVTFNASKVSAVQTSLGDAATRYLNGMAKIWLDSPIGKTAIWGGYTDYGAAKQMFMQNLWAPYLTQVALTGGDQPELRKWHFNLITNYRFDHGVAKGLNVGASYRWAGKPIMGYGIHEATVYGEKAWIADVNQPLYGPTDSHVDLWLGYEHKLNKRVNWRVQLNLRNVGEKTGLTPVAIGPDGSVAQQRISAGQTFDLSCKFMF